MIYLISHFFGLDFFKFSGLPCNINRISRIILFIISKFRNFLGDGVAVFSKNKRPRKRKNKGKNNYCHLEKRWVDFEDLNWSNFILSPPGYEMNICKGKCPSVPIPDHYNTTNHAIFQSIYYHMGAEVNGNRIPPPCCIPIEFGDLTMLTSIDKDLLSEAQFKIYENVNVNPVTMRIFPNMIATRCGCR